MYVNFITSEVSIKIILTLVGNTRIKIAAMTAIAIRRTIVTVLWLVM